MKRHLTSVISQTFGKFANKEFSPFLQTIINKTYISLMGLNMSEFNLASSYASLNKLFTRKLEKQRDFSLDADDFISPCDSWISACGNILKDTALQIKGMEYRYEDFLGDKFSQEEKLLIDNGMFINFYLSPKDYHRYHMPTNTKILKVVHIPGKFYPVNVPSLKKKVNLFIENERVVLKCQSQSGKIFYMILVSALNVGVMNISFEPKIKTNADIINSSVYEYENINLDKGEDFGCFEMGSTIVILAEKDMLELNIKTNDNVKFGQTIAKVI
ncbi:MAG: phosphatidylserine decarboxylase [Thiovulaceae bacterium]|nr:phosphatidylserine decarboxylase [Sulfurimonadaceae bacterium]MCW9026577.1 phosphatidylserine decarboxylase [Sulfurimonadaceae bacterium]